MRGEVASGHVHRQRNDLPSCPCTLHSIKSKSLISRRRQPRLRSTRTTRAQTSSKHCCVTRDRAVSLMESGCVRAFVTRSKTLKRVCLDVFAPHTRDRTTTASNRSQSSLTNFVCQAREYAHSRASPALARSCELKLADEFTRLSGCRTRFQALHSC